MNIKEFYKEEELNKCLWYIKNNLKDYENFILNEEHLNNLLYISKELKNLQEDTSFKNLLENIHKQILNLGSDWAFNSEPDINKIKQLKNLIIVLNFFENVKDIGNIFNEYFNEIYEEDYIIT